MTVTHVHTWRQVGAADVECTGCGADRIQFLHTPTDLSLREQEALNDRHHGEDHSDDEGDVL